MTDPGGAVLRAGVDPRYPPMAHVDRATGRIAGFEAGLVRVVCARIGRVPRFVPMAWDGLFAALEAGEVDLVAAGVSITPEREEAMAFSDPHLVVPQSVLARAGDAGLGAQVFAGAGRRLGAEAATVNAALAETLARPGAVRLYGALDDAVEALRAAEVDGVVADGPIAEACARAGSGALAVAFTNLAPGPLGFAFRRGAGEASAFSAGLGPVREDGTLDALFAAHCGA